MASDSGLVNSTEAMEEAVELERPFEREEDVLEEVEDAEEQVESNELEAKRWGVQEPMRPFMKALRVVGTKGGEGTD